MRRENVDPNASYRYSSEGQPVALILIARRGWTTRVAARAVAPEFRGQGVGQRMLMKVIEEDRARGDRR
jgi:GNAT superfamily N-acetyltransferase